MCLVWEIVWFKVRYFQRDVSDMMWLGKGIGEGVRFVGVEDGVGVDQLFIFWVLECGFFVVLECFFLFRLGMEGSWVQELLWFGVVVWIEGGKGLDFCFQFWEVVQGRQQVFWFLRGLFFCSIKVFFQVLGCLYRLFCGCEEFGFG